MYDIYILFISYVMYIYDCIGDCMVEGAEGDRDAADCIQR